MAHDLFARVTPRLTRWLWLVFTSLFILTQMGAAAATGCGMIVGP